MWIFLLLKLMADANTPVPENAVALTVYRSRAELPAAWQRVVPESFDFGKRMLASAASARQEVELTESPTRVEQRRGDLYLWPNPSPPPQARQCPPCRGVADRREVLEREVAPPPARRPKLPMLTLPRSAGRVLQVHDLAASSTIDHCVPCTAP